MKSQGQSAAELISKRIAELAELAELGDWRADLLRPAPLREGREVTSESQAIPRTERRNTVTWKG